MDYLAKYVLNPLLTLKYAVDKKLTVAYMIVNELIEH